MKIGIIGYGYVGRAVANAHSNDTLIVRDPLLSESAELTDFVNCDAIFVSVPSPRMDDGRCDSSILENVLKELLFVVINKQIPIICKTTATPEVYDRLLKQYPNIVHCPEFLTAKRAYTDYAMSRYFIFGGNSEWCEKAKDIVSLGKVQAESYIITDIKTASLFKYMMNCYLATKVTFMNDFYNLANGIGADWKTMTDIIYHDPRIGNTHLSVPGDHGEFGWGGACFPKDVSAIIEYALDENIDFELMDRVESINKKHTNKQHD